MCRDACGCRLKLDYSEDDLVRGDANRANRDANIGLFTWCEYEFHERCGVLWEGKQRKYAGESVALRCYNWFKDDRDATQCGCCERVDLAKSYRGKHDAESIESHVRIKYWDEHTAVADTLAESIVCALSQNRRLGRVAFQIFSGNADPTPNPSATSTTTVISVSVPAGAAPAVLVPDPYGVPDGAAFVAPPIGGRVAAPAAAAVPPDVPFPAKLPTSRRLAFDSVEDDDSIHDVFDAAVASLTSYDVGPKEDLRSPEGQ